MQKQMKKALLSLSTAILIFSGCSNETIKPIIVTVEDHYPHGGFGDFVLSSLSDSKVQVEKMAVSKIPVSGTAEQVLSYCGIGSKDIVKKVKSLL